MSTSTDIDEEDEEDEKDDEEDEDDEDDEDDEEEERGAARQTTCARVKAETLATEDEAMRTGPSRWYLPLDARNLDPDPDPGHRHAETVCTSASTRRRHALDSDRACTRSFGHIGPLGFLTTDEPPVPNRLRRQRDHACILGMDFGNFGNFGSEISEKGFCVTSNMNSPEILLFGPEEGYVYQVPANATTVRAT